MSEHNQAELNTYQKIMLGGLGALTPVIMNLLAVDLEKLLINITIISVIAYLIKVIILFYIGGLVAYLNSDENKPIKLFQLGIYAPAMIIAFMNTNPLHTSAVQPAPTPVAVSPTPDNRQSKSIEQTPQRPEVSTSSSDASSSVLQTTKTLEFFFNAFNPRNETIADTLGSEEVYNDFHRALEIEDSMFLSPMLNVIARKDAALMDTLLEGVKAHKKSIEEVKLLDTQVYQYSYPQETTSEQFYRGFFGWQSNRLWFVVVGKFADYQSAEMYAKRITLEINKHDNKKLARDTNGDLLIPQIFKPYGAVMPEYSVVMGTHLSIDNAQKVAVSLHQAGYKSLKKNKMELWKLPY